MVCLLFLLQAMFCGNRRKSRYLMLEEYLFWDAEHLYNRPLPSNYNAPCSVVAHKVSRSVTSAASAIFLTCYLHHLRWANKCSNRLWYWRDNSSITKKNAPLVQLELKYFSLFMFTIQNNFEFKVLLVSKAWVLIFERLRYWPFKYKKKYIE